MNHVRGSILLKILAGIGVLVLALGVFAFLRVKESMRQATHELPRMLNERVVELERAKAFPPADLELLKSVASVANQPDSTFWSVSLAGGMVQFASDDLSLTEQERSHLATVGDFLKAQSGDVTQREVGEFYAAHPEIKEMFDSRRPTWSELPKGIAEGMSAE